jgi:hypothetical protein
MQLIFKAPMEEIKVDKLIDARMLLFAMWPEYR